jgi:hypothetical protein
MRILLTKISLILTMLSACKQEANLASGDGPLQAYQIETLQSPAGAGSEEPNLFEGSDGNLYLSWVQKDSTGLAVLQFASFRDGEWSLAEEIARGDDWFVNWADYPAMAVDKLGNMIASYLPKSSAGTYSYDVALRTKPRGASSWSAEFLLNEDGFNGEHGFVSMLAKPDSGFFISWLDGRQGAEKGPMSIRGAFLNPQGEKLREDALDLRVCDCCQTSAAWPEKGPVVFYRDRSDTEVRDISVSRLEAGQWQRGNPVFADNWLINGCPVNGPRSDARGKHLAVAWFSMPHDTAEVKLAFSNDNGETFEDPIMISKGSPLGRVDVAWWDEEVALVSWLDETETAAAIRCAWVHREKGIILSQKIADTQAARTSGFPQMCVHNNEIYFAWTQLGEASQVTCIRLNNKTEITQN